MQQNINQKSSLYCDARRIQNTKPETLAMAEHYFLPKRQADFCEGIAMPILKILRYHIIVNGKIQLTTH